MTTLQLKALQPFNFHSVVNSHGWRQLAPFRFEDDMLYYVDQLSTQRVVEYQISPTSEGVQVQTEKLTKAEQREAAEKVNWMLGLDMDFSDFYAASRVEPKLARAQGQALGRVLRSPTLFEDVIKTILTTNTLWAATKNMTRKLVEEFGAPVGLDTPIAYLPRAQVPAASALGYSTNDVKRAFPTPQAIAASNADYIKEKIRVGYRAPAIHDLAVRVASGGYDLEALKHSSLPTLELRKELLTIRGVGPYAAANLLMLLGRSDFIPVDSWALMLVSHEWYRGKPVTARDVEKRFAKWGEYKGLAFWFWDWKYNGG
jgi:3-methyladenine DNA glycosylase/8-oxoguanine DNA glycosylase